MGIYKKYVTPYLSAFILGPIFMIVEVIGEVLLPKMMSLIINEGIKGGAGSGYIITHGIIMVLLALCMMCGGVLGAYFAVKASVNFAGDLRKDIFAKVQQFSFANIEKFSTGSLVTRLTNDITNLQNVFNGASNAPSSTGDADRWIDHGNHDECETGDILGVVIPVLIEALVVVIGKAFPRFNIMQTKIDSLNSRIQENITNTRVVKSFVRDEFEKETFNKANEDLKEKSLSAMKIVILTMPIMTLAMNITTMAVVWFGGRQIIVGDMPVGDLTAFYDVYRTDPYVADDGWNDHDSRISCPGFFETYQRSSYDRDRPQ